jgi:hypothetical protein
MFLFLEILTLMFSSFNPAWAEKEAGTQAIDIEGLSIVGECTSLRAERFLILKPPVEPAWYFMNDDSETLGIRFSYKKNNADKATITYSTAMGPKEIVGIMPPSMDHVEKTSIFGLLPLRMDYYNQGKPNGDYRKYRYDMRISDIVRKISTMKPGEELTFDYSEKSKLLAQEKIIVGTAYLKFLGCGTYPENSKRILKKFSIQVDARSISPRENIDKVMTEDILRSFDGASYFPYMMGTVGEKRFLVRTID